MPAREFALIGYESFFPPQSAFFPLWPQLPGAMVTSPHRRCLPATEHPPALKNVPAHAPRVPNPGTVHEIPESLQEPVVKVTSADLGKE